MASKYPGFTPFAYAANNPLRYIDPTGMTIEPAGEEEAKLYSEYRGRVDAAVQAYDNRTSKVRDSWFFGGARARGREKRRSSNSFVQIQGELDALENDPEVFRIRMGDNIVGNVKDSGGNFNYNDSTKEFDVNVGSNSSDFSDLQILAHELKHADQYLKGDIGFEFRPNTAISSPLFYDRTDEEAAFSRQNLFTTNPISDVRSHVAKLYDHLPSARSGSSNLNSSKKAEYRKRMEFAPIKLRGI